MSEDYASGPRNVLEFWESGSFLVLSGILLPMSLAPQWFQTVSDVNPLKHVVDAVRSIFLGNLTSTTTAFGVGLAILLVMVGIYIGTRTFHRESA